MQRRTLLGSTAALLAATAAATDAMALNAPAGKAAAKPPKGAKASAAVTPPAALTEQSATTLLPQLAAGGVSAEQLVRACLARIAAVDRAGPRINSILELNPDALADARALDAGRRTRRPGTAGPGALHGLPVLLKDNIATGDKMRTSAGSLALAETRAVRDAHLVKRLRDAGAVILGKTNLSEWANIRSTRSTSGWSARGGLTRNPYALDRNTSGSSSGTAAAIAAGLAPLGVGTETDGSIVSPASICGLVGLKPTVGRVSRDGVIPISHTQDTAGPMTRTVADCALLHAVLSGADERDPVTVRAPALPADTTLNASALQGARLGIARNFLIGFDEADAVFERAVQQLRALGAVVIDDIALPAVGYSDAELSVLLYELKHGLPLWLKAFAPQAPVQSLADVIAFNSAHRAQEMALFGQELFDKAQALGGLDTPAYREALAAIGKAAREDGLDKVINQHRLDAVIAPSGGPAWLSDPIAGDHYGASFSTPAAVAGYPHLTVPMGLVRGLPLGLSFVGPAWSEWRLLNLGFAYEQAAQARRAPAFMPRSVPV